MLYKVVWHSRAGVTLHDVLLTSQQAFHLVYLINHFFIIIFASPTKKVRHHIKNGKVSSNFKLDEPVLGRLFSSIFIRLWN